jgi:hypothetical protein
VTSSLCTSSEVDQRVVQGIRPALGARPAADAKAGVDGAAGAGRDEPAGARVAKAIDLEREAVGRRPVCGRPAETRPGRRCRARGWPVGSHRQHRLRAISGVAARGRSRGCAGAHRGRHRGTGAGGADGPPLRPGGLAKLPIDGSALTASASAFPHGCEPARERDTNARPGRPAGARPPRQQTPAHIRDCSSRWRPR